MPYRTPARSPPILAAGATERGSTRFENQDRFKIGHGRCASVCVVADGMGGLGDGGAASDIVTKVTTEWLTNPSVDGTTERVRAAIQAANQAILDVSRADVRNRGIGSTVALLVVEGPAAYVAHVGDSRVYLARGGELTQLTEDHSLANFVRDEKRKNPLFTFDEALLAVHTNVITRALGVTEEVEVDQSTIEIREGDVFLLCTDGLCGAISDAQILNIIERSGGDVQRACTALVSEALAACGPTPERSYPSGDDIGVIVARVLSTEESPRPLRK